VYYQRLVIKHYTFTIYIISMIKVQYNIQLPILMALYSLYAIKITIISKNQMPLNKQYCNQH